MGNKSLEELIHCISTHTGFILGDDKDSETLHRLIERITDTIRQEKPDFDYADLILPLRLALSGHIKELTYTTEEELERLISSDPLKKAIIDSPYVRKALDTKIYDIISHEQNPIPLYRLVREFPGILSPDTSIPEESNKLIGENKIELCADGLRRKLSHIKDWLEHIEGKNRQAVELRLQGKTLEACGAAMGLTRERIRQIVEREINKKPPLREDDYAYWFRTYDLDKETMTSIFGINEEIYHYLCALHHRGKNDIDNIPSDPNLTETIEKGYQKYANRNKILMDGEYILIDRNTLCRALAKKICSDQPIKYSKFNAAYRKMLEQYGLENQEKLTFSSFHALEARIQDSMCLLTNYGSKMRYYPINEYDVEQLTDDLHLDQFENVEISAQKLCDEYPEIMKEYDIHNGYELHNLLNKTETIWNKDRKYDIKIGRMPFLAFGHVDRARQAEELLYLIAPVSFEEFGEYYELEYGVKAATASANMGSLISKYYHDGYFRVDQPRMTEEERNYMASTLQKDFYFTADVQEIFKEKFGPSHISHINPRTLKELGYRVFSKYLIKNTYTSADNYFRTLFTANDRFDLATWGPRIMYIQTAWQTLDELRTNYEIIEYDDKKYMKLSAFDASYGPITKEALKQYAEDAIRASGSEPFFTIPSLKQNGFTHKLHDLGLKNWFYDSLLRNSQKLLCIRTNGAFLYAKTTPDKKITLADFIAFILAKTGEMPISGLISHIYENYGIILKKDKLIQLVRNTRITYDHYRKTLSLNNLNRSETTDTPKEYIQPSLF